MVYGGGGYFLSQGVGFILGENVTHGGGARFSRDSMGCVWQVL